MACIENIHFLARRKQVRSTGSFFACICVSVAFGKDKDKCKDIIQFRLPS